MRQTISLEAIRLAESGCFDCVGLTPERPLQLLGVRPRRVQVVVFGILCESFLLLLLLEVICHHGFLLVFAHCGFSTGRASTWLLQLANDLVTVQCRRRVILCC
jgi:hypothetical protein